jgi:hypothetical protein
MKDVVAIDDMVFQGRADMDRDQGQQAGDQGPVHPLRGGFDRPEGRRGKVLQRHQGPGRQAQQG